jgi:hypothetical protein
LTGFSDAAVGRYRPLGGCQTILTGCILNVVQGVATSFACVPELVAIMNSDFKIFSSFAAKHFH